MRVLVAGASGAIGQRLVPQLIAAGHDVVATSRSPAKGERLRGLGAESVLVDGLDETAVVEAVRRAEPEVVIHEMTALAGASNLRRWDKWFATTNELRTKGTDYLIRAAQLAGARRLIAQSYTGWTNAREGGWVKSEEDPLDPRPPPAMHRSLDAIRYLEREVPRARHLEGIVLRYGSLYGPGTAMENEYVELIRRRRMPIVGDGAGMWSFVHVDDAGAATVAAIERGEPGLYNVVDDEPVRASEWLPHLAGALGARPPRRVPTWLGRLLAGEVGVSLMTRIRGSSNAKARRGLGWEPRWSSLREGAATIGAVLPRGVSDGSSHDPGARGRTRGRGGDPLAQSPGPAQRALAGADGGGDRRPRGDRRAA